MCCLIAASSGAFHGMALECAAVRNEGSTALLTLSSTNMAICSRGLPVLNNCSSSNKQGKQACSVSAHVQLTTLCRNLAGNVLLGQ